MQLDKIYFPVWARIAHSVWRLATGSTVRGSNLGRVKIFHTRPDRLSAPPILLYNGYRVSFPGVKRPGCGVNHRPPFCAEVRERVDLCLCYSSGLHGLLQAGLHILYFPLCVCVCSYYLINSPFSLSDLIPSTQLFSRSVVSHAGCT